MTFSVVRLKVRLVSWVTCWGHLFSHFFKPFFGGHIGATKLGKAAPLSSFTHFPQTQMPARTPTLLRMLCWNTNSVFVWRESKRITSQCLTHCLLLRSTLISPSPHLLTQTFLVPHTLKDQAIFQEFFLFFISCCDTHCLAAGTATIYHFIYTFLRCVYMSIVKEQVRQDSVGLGYWWIVIRNKKKKGFVTQMEEERVWYRGGEYDYV